MAWIFVKADRPVGICQVKNAGDMGLCGAWRTQLDRAIAAGDDDNNEGEDDYDDDDDNNDHFLLGLL